MNVRYQPEALTLRQVDDQLHAISGDYSRQGCITRAGLCEHRAQLWAALAARSPHMHEEFLQAVYECAARDRFAAGEWAKRASDGRK
jgi:hypothetical protein